MIQTGKSKIHIYFNLKISLESLVLECRTAVGNAIKFGKLKHCMYRKIICVKNPVEIQRGKTYIVEVHFSWLNLTHFFVKTANCVTYLSFQLDTKITAFS
jgi:hypothetical protein